MVCMGLAAGVSCGGEASPGKRQAAEEKEPSGTSSAQAAALERALRFTYGATCAEYDSLRLDETATKLGFATEIIQRDPTAWGATRCLQIGEETERKTCLSEMPDCSDSQVRDDLDWSQWPEHTTVIEIIGLAPEQVNPSSMGLYGVTDSDSDSRQSEIVLAYSGFYEEQQPHGAPPMAPPGSNECAYYWYLDATPRGIALVLSWNLAYDADADFPNTELTLCLTDQP